MADRTLKKLIVKDFNEHVGIMIVQKENIIIVMETRK